MVRSLVPLVAGLAALASPSAFPGEPDTEANLDIVVTAEHDVVVARAELFQAVRDLGYLPGLDVGDHTVFLPQRRWKPRITVWDDGRVKVAGFALTPLYGSVGPWYLEVHGLWGTRRQARRNEDDALHTLQPLVARYEAALVGRTLAQRLEDVGRQLERVWAGEARDGSPLATAEARRAEIVAMWLDTADTEAGARVRERIERFAAEVVQDSGDPFVPAEIDAANQRRTFAAAWVAR